METEIKSQMPKLLGDGTPIRWTKNSAGELMGLTPDGKKVGRELSGGIGFEIELRPSIKETRRLRRPERSEKRPLHLPIGIRWVV
ncbi:MAG: hypothetical protein CEN88_171 [Candidatus Berkelbacteria bacterium Licking1014_2]|uniref:Uncharacterized protein n=1 Tax=Candidatus Berkelbacteria bacterium Licking1014_2 TaxID=2017146 RepID=A0A554LW82_9BACT|nr:MAG: hypothetical protein CEN88_171 [Candidatus Berkelbacteria bacterium Licking1014_2]